MLVDGALLQANCTGALRRPLLAHELIHVALDPKAAQRTPAWLFEGLAMYLSGDLLGGPTPPRRSCRSLVRTTSDRRLLRPRRDLERRGRAQWNAYVVATAAVDAIVRRHGAAGGALRAPRRFRDTSITGSACRATELVLRDRLRMTVEELDRAIAAG